MERQAGWCFSGAVRSFACERMGLWDEGGGAVSFTHTALHSHLSRRQGGLGDLSSAFPQLPPALLSGWMNCVLPSLPLCVSAPSLSPAALSSLQHPPWPPRPRFLYHYPGAVSLRATHVTSLSLSFYINEKVMGVLIPRASSVSSCAPLSKPSRLAFSLYLALTELLLSRIPGLFLPSHALPTFG